MLPCQTSTTAILRRLDTRCALLPGERGKLHGVATVDRVLPLFRRRQCIPLNVPYGCRRLSAFDDGDHFSYSAERPTMAIGHVPPSEEFATFGSRTTSRIRIW